MLVSETRQMGLQESATGCGDPGSCMRQHADAAGTEESLRHWPAAGGNPDDAEFNNDEEEASSVAAPTLATSGYMTNSSLSSCFGEMRSSNTQDSLGQLRTQRRWEAGLAAEFGTDWPGADAADAEAADSERAQWRALEQRLAELAKSAAAEELRKRRPPRRHRPRRQAETERERVLRALSSCGSEDDNLAGRPDGESEAEAAGAASFGSSTTAWSCSGGDGSGGGFSAGMELCFRNDAASEDEDDALGGINEQEQQQQQQQWQRFRRPPRSFVPSVATELTASMQLCFISDPATSDDDETAGTVASTGSGSTSSDKPPPPPPPLRPSRRPLEPELLASLGLEPPPPPSPPPVEQADGGDAGCRDAASDAGCLRRRQAELQAEAQVALAQAEPMARMQLAVERHARDRRCRDALAEMLGVAPSRRLGASCLEMMSLGALQLAHNSLLARIEEHNSELVRCLIERDDLHMEQDAMLVEIEDLTRRAHEADTAATAAASATASTSVGVAEKTTAAANDTVGTATAAPVRRRMSMLTARLRPKKLVSLFTGT
ncbi:hypothetical protein BOX15_Mlig000873g2 [Macrostomum lignano]|uniref:Schwannomin interacting protein 1 C-terminal domain-containing protein n=2 Tax=Macrostomum lignano TaxID=282301 RepID=A0A267EP50_9PLAT|nr:hypothetical protein BOX15_Mlig000873g2 [Macrostomum lignano]